jgi:hypothetical protein
VLTVWTRVLCFMGVHSCERFREFVGVAVGKDSW